MKKITLTLTLLLGITFSVFAQKYDDEKDFTVEIIDNGNAVRITKYEGNKNVVSIPSKIQNLPVTEIGKETFKDYTILTSITIPNSVTSIEEGAFADCTSLTALNVAVDNNAYTAENGILYTKNKTALVVYPAGKTGAFIIPNNVTSIKKYAFHGSTSLTSVTISKSVSGIGNYAFYDCTNLNSVTFQGLISPHFFSGFDDRWDNEYGLSTIYLSKNGGPGKYKRTAYGEEWKKQ